MRTPHKANEVPSKVFLLELKRHKEESVRGGIRQMTNSFF